MVKKWLHLEFEAGSSWGFKTSAAITKAVQAGKRPRASRKLSQMPLHIGTRLNMLPRIIRRINQECSLLYDAVKQHDPEHVFTLGHKGYVFAVDEELKYNLLIDIDSFLFEINACCDLVVNLIHMAYDHIERGVTKKKVVKIVRKVITDSGQDTRWFVELRNTRNLFIHNATPYIAVDISEEENSKYDILIMKENLHEFNENSKKWILLSSLSNILQGFQEAMPRLEGHIVSLYT